MSFAPDGTAEFNRPGDDFAEYAHHRSAKGSDPMILRRMATATKGPGSVTDRTAAKQVVISSFDSANHPHYNGGGVAVIEMIASRLASQFDVTIVTVGHRGRSEESLPNGVRCTSLPIGWAGPRAAQLLYHAMLPIVARRIPHDLWIENFTPPFSTSFVPLFSRARVLGFAQSLAGAEMSVKYKLPFFLIERLGLRFYRDIVVLNAADRAVVSAASPSATVRIIPNGIHQTILDEQILGRGDHILFLGRIDVWKKGLDLLLAAYEKSGLTMPLLIAGAGTPREERKLTALLAATNGEIRWVGHVTGQRKQELLERSAFVVMPSRHETFGLSALEGMSCGKPVLHFDLPTLRWIDSSVCVPPLDINALAAQMRALAGDEATRRYLGRLAHAAAQRHGHDETADRYVALAHELLGSSGNGAGAEGDALCQ
jgi:glycosyltransferase involved in cell wall biosynthesis